MRKKDAVEVAYAIKMILQVREAIDQMTKATDDLARVMVMDDLTIHVAGTQKKIVIPAHAVQFMVEEGSLGSTLLRFEKQASRNLLDLAGITIEEE